MTPYGSKPKRARMDLVLARRSHWSMPLSPTGYLNSIINNSRATEGPQHRKKPVLNAPRSLFCCCFYTQQEITVS